VTLLEVSRKDIEALIVTNFLDPLHSFTSVSPGSRSRGLAEKLCRLEARRRMAGKKVQESWMAGTTCNLE